MRAGIKRVGNNAKLDLHAGGLGRGALHKLERGRCVCDGAIAPDLFCGVNGRRYVTIVHDHDQGICAGKQAQCKKQHHRLHVAWKGGDNQQVVYDRAAATEAATRGFKTNWC